MSEKDKVFQGALGKAVSTSGTASAEEIRQKMIQNGATPSLINAVVSLADTQIFETYMAWFTDRMSDLLLVKDKDKTQEDLNNIITAIVMMHGNVLGSMLTLINNANSTSHTLTEIHDDLRRICSGIADHALDVVAMNLKNPTQPN